MKDVKDVTADLFNAAIDTFPAELQEQAIDWLAEREAALMVIRQLEEKGLTGFLFDNENGGKS